MENRKLVIKEVDMSDTMQTEAIKIASDAFEKYKSETDVAEHIKVAFDEKYGIGNELAWQCFVGDDFGSGVHHQPNHYIHFSMGSVDILLFK